MLNQDVLREFIFECEMRKLSPRTVQSYRNANLRMLKYIEQEFVLYTPRSGYNKVC